MYEHRHKTNEVRSLTPHPSPASITLMLENIIVPGANVIGKKASAFTHSIHEAYASMCVSMFTQKGAKDCAELCHVLPWHPQWEFCV